MKKLFSTGICTVVALAALLAWSPCAQAQPAPIFSKGADVGWLTQMEASGRLFYNAAGVQQDLLQILRDYDMNTIRLRVWVNPAGGWNGKNDVVVKAIRAHNQGFRLMIDFHYSDSWADPGQQNKPAAWANLTFPQLKTALYNHTFDVLDSLKDHNIVPEWVQVGNETPNGMLWPDGRISTNPQNFAELVDMGYQAVKAVNPTSKVIVHVDQGNNSARFRYVFDRLAQYGARYDVIGMSLYPTPSNWPTLTAQCQANMNDLVNRYPGKEVMMVETGMPVNAPIPTQQMLLDLMSKVRAVPGNKGLGVLYWEPQAYNWMAYNKGAWDNSGRPTEAMEAFRNVPPSTGLVYNPGFEYTAASQTALGWTTDAPTGDTDADFTQNYGRASNLNLTHEKAASYQVRTYQMLSNVPNGTYTLRAWVLNSGGQNVCQLYATPAGSPEQNVAVPATSGNWVQVQVPGVTVANGQCEIGLRSNANAGNACSLDDVEFVLTQATAVRTAALADKLNLAVFPNPAAGPLSVSFELERGETVQVCLYSLMGQLLRTVGPAQRLGGGAHTLVVDPSGTLGPGTYLLALTHGGRVATRLFTKE